MNSIILIGIKFSFASEARRFLEIMYSIFRVNKHRSSTDKHQKRRKNQRREIRSENSFEPLMTSFPRARERLFYKIKSFQENFPVNTRSALAARKLAGSFFSSFSLAARSQQQQLTARCNYRTDHCTNMHKFDQPVSPETIFKLC